MSEHDVLTVILSEIHALRQEAKEDRHQLRNDLRPIIEAIAEHGVKIEQLEQAQDTRREWVGGVVGGVIVSVIAWFVQLFTGKS